MSETPRILMNISPNQGYGPDQVETRMTLSDLLAEVEAAIIEWGEDAVIVTRDHSNRYGAGYGRLDSLELFEDPESDDDY